MKTCPKHVSSQAPSKHVQNTSQTWAKHVPNTSRTRRKHVPNTTQKRARHVPNMLQTSLGIRENNKRGKILDEIKRET